MDFESITGAYSALSAAKQIAQTMLTLRDFNQSASAIAQINEQLLKAQEGLFAHNAQLMQLQQQHFEACKELRELKEAVTERSRYALFEISPDVFVYRMNVAPEQSGSSDPRSAEPLHHLCQPCFDRGIKVVLNRHNHFGAIYLKCGDCGGEYFTGRSEPWLPARVDF